VGNGRGNYRVSQNLRIPNSEPGTEGPSGGRKILRKKIALPEEDISTLILFNTYRVSQKWRTNGALRCRRDYRKRQKNVKKILLDLFSDLAVFECGT
jgi:hypothetical protein